MLTLYCRPGLYFFMVSSVRSVPVCILCVSTMKQFNLPKLIPYLLAAFLIIIEISVIIIWESPPIDIMDQEYYISGKSLIIIIIIIIIRIKLQLFFNAIIFSSCNNKLLFASCTMM